jgi:hypothetical protein
MKPGATTRPSASMVLFAVSFMPSPIAAIFPAEMATSARLAGAPVPSMSVAALISVS